MLALICLAMLALVGGGTASATMVEAEFSPREESAQSASVMSDGGSIFSIVMSGAAPYSAKVYNLAPGKVGWSQIGSNFNATVGANGEAPVMTMDEGTPLAVWANPSYVSGPITNPAQVRASWWDPGAYGWGDWMPSPTVVNPDTSRAAGSPSSAIVNHSPAVAMVQTTASSDQVRVSVATGHTWNALPAVFNRDPAAYGRGPQLVGTGTSGVVAWIEETAGGERVYASRFDPGTGNATALGGAIEAAAGAPQSCRIATSRNQPVLACTFLGGGRRVMIANRFNELSQTWERVGGAVTPDDVDILDADIAAEEDVVWLLQRVARSGARELSLSRLLPGASSWELIETFDAAAAPTTARLAISRGVPWVVSVGHDRMFKARELLPNVAGLKIKAKAMHTDVHFSIDDHGLFAPISAGLKDSDVDSVRLATLTSNGLNFSFSERDLEYSSDYVVSVRAVDPGGRSLEIGTQKFVTPREDGVRPKVRLKFAARTSKPPAVRGHASDNDEVRRVRIAVAAIGSRRCAWFNGRRLVSGRCEKPVWKGGLTDGDFALELPRAVSKRLARGVYGVLAKAQDASGNWSREVGYVCFRKPRRSKTSCAQLKPGK